MTGALLVFVGGGLGALLRYLAGLLVEGPLATFAVNISGSFAIGLLAAAIPIEESNLRLFFLTGLLGGFTTFSAFSLDALNFAQQGELGSAAAYILASVVVSLAAAALGVAVAR